jgi:hypothetical protein
MFGEKKTLVFPWNQNMIRLFSSSYPTAELCWLVFLFNPMDYIFPCLNYAKTPFKPKSITKLCDVPVSLLYKALMNRQRTYEITAYYLKPKDQKHTKITDISLSISVKLVIISSAKNIYLV